MCFKEIKRKKSSILTEELTHKKEDNGCCCGLVSCLLKYISKYFFLFGFGIVLIIAIIYPKLGSNSGPLNPPITSSWISVIIQFLLTGYMVETAELKRATLFLFLIVVTQFMLYVYFPLVGYVLYQVLPSLGYHSMQLLDGLVICTCLPGTLSSGTIFTLNCNGNVSAATVNSVITNVLGVGVTPLLIALLLNNLGIFMYIFMIPIYILILRYNIHYIGNVDAGDVLFKVGMRIIVPFMMGQIIRIIIKKYTSKNVDKYKIVWKRICEISLLYILFCGISESLYTGIDATGVDLIIMFIITLFLHVGTWFLLWLVLNYVPYCNNKFTIQDIVAIAMISSRKSLAFGVPMIATLFGDTDDIGVYTVPIVIMHPIQLIVGSFMITPIQNYVNKRTETEPKETNIEQKLLQDPIKLHNLV